MKVLLTGSSGFIGGELKKALLAAGHEVYCLNRRHTGASREIVWDFVSRLPGSMPNAVDAIVHLAARASFENKFDGELYQVNTVATSQLAEWAQKVHAFFIFASMAGLHGDATLVNQGIPVNPSNHYAISKYIAEEEIRATLDHFVILRIGGVYGLDGPSHLGLNRAISRAYYETEVPVLVGPGTIRRNYICASDVALWMIALLPDKTKDWLPSPRLVYVAGPEVLTLKYYLETTTRILTSAAGPILKDGDIGSDFIIETDEPPMPLTTFEAYLGNLSRRRQELCDGVQLSASRVEG